MKPLYCKWCGETTHVAGRECPRMKSKWGTRDSPTGQGEYKWFFPPNYSTWHSTIQARTEDEKIVGLDGAR